ncbi:MAG: alpha/beta hydrolase [Pseudomonadota bacterium]
MRRDGQLTYLLIHGAWAGPWIWEQTAAHLSKAGHTVVVGDPLGQLEPGVDQVAETFETAMRRLTGLVDKIGGPLIAVGHSGGGVFASALAEARPDRIATLAYVAGFMLPSKTNYSEIAAQQAPGWGIGPHLNWNAQQTTSQVPVEAAVEVFFHDCKPADARATARCLTPFPEAVRSAAPVLTNAQFGRVPRVYIECIGDRSIPLAAQRQMQRLVPGARCISLDCGHAPMLARPETFCAALIELCEGS